MTLTKPQRDALLRLSQGAKTIAWPIVRINLVAMRLVTRVKGETKRKEYELTEAGRTALAERTP